MQPQKMSVDVGHELRGALLKYVLWMLAVAFTPRAVAQHGAANTPESNKLKREAIEFLSDHERDFIALSDSLWKYAEPSLQEVRSSAAVAGMLKSHGFHVRSHVAGFPTAFVATYGRGEPVIGFFGEYDADAQASNEVVPFRRARPSTEHGHGGHHNLLGAGSAAAALALAKLIDQKKLPCTVRYFGTTAEGTVGSKSFLASDGYFDDLDFCLYWHPSPVTSASVFKWDSRLRMQIIFATPRVDIAHKVPDTCNALSAAESFMGELSQLRKSISAGRRLHYGLEVAAQANIPDTIRFEVAIQAATQVDAVDLMTKVKDAATGTQSLTGVSLITRVTESKYQYLPNVTAAKAVYKNMHALEPVTYSRGEQLFVRKLQRELGSDTTGISSRQLPFADRSADEAVYGYASDIGDASWIAPEVYFTVQTLPSVAMHQWPGTIFSAHSIGHQGMMRAAKILAMTAIDFVLDDSFRQSVWEEFESRRGGKRYEAYLRQ